MNMVDNPFSLQGKTILVTGASSGIGRAISIACSRMGAKGRKRVVLGTSVDLGGRRILYKHCQLCV